MAVDMNPNRSAFTPQGNSLLNTRTQIASVSNVDEPEETLESLAAVTPAMPEQEAQSVTPEPQVDEGLSAPVEPEIPVEQEDPIVEPKVYNGVEVADEATINEVTESLSPTKETTSGSYVESEVDYDHPWFKEEAKRKLEQRKSTVATSLSTISENRQRLTLEDIQRQVEENDVAAVEVTAKEEYEMLGNQAKRSLYGFVETPRYLLSIPGLTSRVVERKATDSNSRLLKGYSTALSAMTSFVMDTFISQVTGISDLDYDTNVVEPVLTGRTVDQKFENDLLSSIKKRTGVTLSEGYLRGRTYIEVAQESALTMGLSGFLSGVRQGSSLLSAKLAGYVAGEAAKGGVSGVAAVAGSEAAISLIDPKSKEAEILTGMIGGTVAAPVAAAVTSTTGKMATYSPTGLVVRGSKILLDKARHTVSDLKRDRKIGEIMRVEGADRKEAIRRYYTRLDNDSPDKKNLALSLLNDTDLTNDERMIAVNDILDTAMNDPLSREAEVVRTAIMVMEKDKKAIAGAWTQAELLNKAFDDPSFRADVFDVYNGKFKDTFLHLREEVAPDDIIKKQSDLLEFIRDRLQKDTTLSELDRSELTSAAVLLEKSMDAEIQNVRVGMQQNVAAALDLTTETKFTQEVPLDSSVNTLRDSLSTVKATANNLLKVGYSSIDTENKVRSKSGFMTINDFLGSLDKSDPAHATIQKSFNSLMSDAVARHRSSSDDLSIIAGTKPNPTQSFTKKALQKADEVVYLNPTQFEQLTGVKLKQGKLEKPLGSIAQLDLEEAGDGSFVVKGSNGAEEYGPLGKETLIPVSMSFDLLSKLEDKKLRIKDQTGAVVQLDLNRQFARTGDDRHNTALLDYTVEEGRKRGNLSQENPQSSFFPKLDINKIDLTYREMDQFQRSIRKAKSQAWNMEDYQAYTTLKDLDSQLSGMLQEALKDQPDSFEQRKALDKLYGDSFVPDFEDTSSLLGKATARKPNKAYAFAMSNLVESLGSKVELRQQLVEILDPSKSKFINSIVGKNASVKLDKLTGMDEKTLRKFEAEGRNVASALLDIKMSDLLESVYKNIGTDVDPREFLVTQIKELQDSKDFNALYIAAEGTETRVLLDKALTLPDDANLNEVLALAQTHLDKFDDIFYKSVRGMKDPSNSKAILDIMGNLDKLDEMEADLVVKGELSKVAPHMIRVVLTDVLKMGDNGFSIATLSNGINKYGASLQRVPGGTEALATLKMLKDSQYALDQLNKSSGKAKMVTGSGASRTAVERVTSYLPSIFSDIKAARKGIVGMDYAVFASVTGIATKEMRALRKFENKAISETLAASLMNKELFDKINSVNRALGESTSSSTKLRNLSLLLHSANGMRVGALESMADLVEASDDTEELLEFLRNTTEFQEVLAEDALLEQEAINKVEPTEDRQ